MSADLDGGAAPASLDELVVVDSLAAPAEDGGSAPQDDSAGTEAGTEADAADLAEAEDAGPAPEPQD
jgi:hypothetical protein